MPLKDPEARKAYMRDRYQRKAEYIKAYQKQYRAENGDKIKVTRRPYQRNVYLMNRVARKIALLLYRGGACDRCGIDNLAVLHFHHRQAEEKSFDVAEAVNSGSQVKHSWATVLAEARKCDLLCANCHMAEHVSWSEDELALMIVKAKTFDMDEKEISDVSGLSLSNGGSDLGAEVADHGSFDQAGIEEQPHGSSEIGQAVGHA